MQMAIEESEEDNQQMRGGIVKVCDTDVFVQVPCPHALEVSTTHPSLNMGSFLKPTSDSCYATHRFQHAKGDIEN